MKVLARHLTGLGILLLTAFILFTACQNESDDDDDSDSSVTDDDDVDDDDSADDDDDSSTWPDACDGKHGPEIWDLKMYVNDELKEDGVTVLTTDSFKIAFEYEDEDCDFNGGFVRIAPQDDEFQLSAVRDSIKHKFTIEGADCSSALAGEPYEIEIDPSLFLIPDSLERTKPWWIDSYDNLYCGTDIDYLDFTVVEP